MSSGPRRSAPASAKGVSCGTRGAGPRTTASPPARAETLAADAHGASRSDRRPMGALSVIRAPNPRGPRSVPAPGQVFWLLGRPAPPPSHSRPRRGLVGAVVALGPGWLSLSQASARGGDVSSYSGGTAVVLHHTSLDREASSFGETRGPVKSRNHSPCTWTTSTRVCGTSRCSNRNSPCHVPRFSSPSVTGSVSLVRVTAARRCEGMSSLPSAVWV